MLRNLWSDTEAAALTGVDLLVYMSRQVGADPALVVWGGGNTSLKLQETDFRGRVIDVMRIKGSGSDLKSVVAKDFPGVRMGDLQALRELADMTDDQMVEYMAHTVLDAGSPRPSIETLLHAWIPAVAVLHSHADAVVALTNTDDGPQVVRRALGPEIALVNYRRPGFMLSKEVADAARELDSVSGVVLAKHGLVTWGDTAKEAYNRHLAIVARAEAYATEQSKDRRVFGAAGAVTLPPAERRRAAARLAPSLRGLLSEHQRVVLRYDDASDVLDFVNSEKAARLSQIGPATPDHLLNTKRLPIVVPVADPTDTERLAEAMREALADYRERYRSYVTRHNIAGVPQLAAEPRVVLVPGLGMWTAGSDVRGARVPGEIYHHTIAVMGAAEAVGSYQSLSEAEAFDAEYWPLELYKLSLSASGGPERVLSRSVALVTGAASGIGRAIAERFVAEGAHVVLADLNGEGVSQVATSLSQRFGEGRCLGIAMDVTHAEDSEEVFTAIRLAFGGLDILVSNAGIAPAGALVEMLSSEWERSMAVNATGHFLVTREALRLMQEQGLGGSLVYIASKNVTAPGAEFGAYSAAKAAEAQLARIAAIEGGPHGIRANIINPDAIFEGSALFSQELRERRAQAHGVDASQLEEFYRRRNLLQTRVLAEDVAEAALFFASRRSAKTTGAMLPVDGGVREAFPR